jgi:hypothetical protein
MANTFIEEVDLEAEERRPTLLDAIEERNRGLGRKVLLHRIVVIAELKHDNYTDIISHYEKIFKDCQLMWQCEHASGLLLLFPRHCLHVLEGPLEIILELCRDLRINKHSLDQTHIVCSKILVISHDIPCRLYQSYFSRVVDIQAANIDLYEPTDGTEKAVVDILVQVLRLGMYINKHAKNAQKAALETIHEKASDLLPQQAVINYLLKNSITCIYTPDEYLLNYETPFDVCLASDLVWPLPVRMFPYN